MPPGQDDFSSAAGLRAGLFRKTLLPLFIEVLHTGKPVHDHYLVPSGLFGCV